MGDFDDIQRCADLTDAHVIVAVRSRAAMRELLERLMTVGRPSEGGPKVLLAFARMATTSCDWIEGDLRVEITDDAGACAIDVLVDLGGGFRERVFPPYEMKVPIDEFIRSVRLVPRLISPLNMQQRGDDRLVFSAREILESEPPPSLVEVEETDADGAVSLGSLNIEVQPMIDAREPVQQVAPFARDWLSEKNKKRPYDPSVHAAKTAVRIPKVDKDALRSDFPPPSAPASVRSQPPATRPHGVEPPLEKNPDELDEDWE